MEAKHNTLRRGWPPRTCRRRQMLMAVYSVLLGGALLLSAPWWLLRMATTSRYREGLRERLGQVPPGLRETVRGRQVVWVHAVSVGEVMAISRLVEELAAALPDSPHPWTILVSTTTRTGQALARERFGAPHVFYFPLDFRWAVRAWLRALQPRLVLLAESELWPRLLHECGRSRIPVAVLNARVSDRSFRRAHRFKALWTPVLRNVTRFLAQSNEDAGRLRSLGADPGSIFAVGNLKYDAREPRPGALTSLLRAACSDRPVLVAGSTVEGEDELVLSSFYEVRQVVPEAILVLAPRHPERFREVATLAEPQGAVRASTLLQEQRINEAARQQKPPFRKQSTPGFGGQPARRGTIPSHGDVPPAVENTEAAAPTSVIVLDTIGDLASVYGLAQAVFVGGTLVPRGGHNPLEPARFGVPVVMGPSVENFRDVVGAMLAAHGLRLIKDEAELTAAFIALLTNREEAHSLGERGRTVFAQQGGATGRSIQLLMPLLDLSDPVLPGGPHADPPRAVPA